MEAHGSASPAPKALPRVVFYLPGTMRSVYDQSVDLLARHLAQACSDVEKRSYVADRTVSSLVLDPSTELKVRQIVCTDDADRNITLIEADYGPILTGSFDERGVVVQFFRLLALLGRMGPTVLRLLLKRIPPPHTRLSGGQKVLVATAYVLGAVVLVSIGAAVFEVVSAVAGALGDSAKDTPWLATALAWIGDAGAFLGRSPWIATATVGISILLVWLSLLGAVVAVAWSLLPSKVPDSISSVGKEYSSLVRYILYGESRNDIEQFVAGVSDCISERFPQAATHVVCFSFGCIVGFNHLFPKSDWQPRFGGRLETVTFLGFPYVIVDAAFPGYLGGRRQLVSRPFRWKNIFLPRDVLGSRIADYLPSMFPGQTPPSLSEERVEPQKAPGSDFVANHMAYWDPAAEKCGEAFKEVARSIKLD